VNLHDGTPAAKLRARIVREGSVPFREFMETALYDPEHGYYRRARDPFGASGDYFTAEQVQPVFGILVAAAVRDLWRQMGAPPDFTVVELGAGRGEMAAAFAEWRYVPVEAASPVLPERFRGVVFSNEFFDALPVETAVFREGAFRELCVGLSGDRFIWIEGGAPRLEV
jgi:SAM-dependent MidA family methyltransferase